VISISENTFATVLEYCGEETLDDHLKARPNGTLSEREARGVVIQLVAGLKAMNRREEPIIHYDLKPSNLIYDRGRLKAKLRGSDDHSNSMRI
jgi:tousled-like kinase